MKKIILITLILAVRLLTLHCEAQETLYVSDLGQASYESNSIGSDSWIAQVFFTGTNAGGYNLSSVQLLMDAASGSPSGFSVSIYSSLDPANNLGTLNGANPLPGGVFSYSASGPGIMLSPSGAYAVVVTALTPVTNGAYYWSTTGGIEVGGADGWWLAGHLTSSDGLNWNAAPRGSVLQMAIYGTPVPEPSTTALIVLGSGLLIYVRRCNKTPVPPPT